MTAPQLIVSIAGIRDGRMLVLSRFVGELMSKGVTPSLLVSPHHCDSFHLAQCPTVQTWLHNRIHDGAELLLSGYNQKNRGRRSEFAVLPAYEAGMWIRAAKRQMHALGFTTDMFSPPGYFCSEGTKEALVGEGFRILSDCRGIHDLVTGQSVAAPVFALGDGTGRSRWTRKMIDRSIKKAIAKRDTVRLVVPAGRLHDPDVAGDLLTMVDEALAGGLVVSTHNGYLQPA